MAATSIRIFAPQSGQDTRRTDLNMIAYWISIGAAAGGLGGLLVGGVGGRVAMFVLRLTSDDSVRGIQSDDDFTIGQFDLLATLNLLFVTAFLGVIVGLLIIAGRPFLPRRWMPFAWGLAGATVGGGILLQQDGVDFTLLEPHLLAVVLFIAIPASGAALIAWLIELYPRFWWQRRKLTVLAAVAMLPLVIVFPVAIFALLAAGICWFAMRSPRARHISEWRPARVAALVVFGAAVALGLFDLAKDVPAIV